MQKIRDYFGSLARQLKPKFGGVRCSFCSQMIRYAMEYYIVLVFVFMASIFYLITVGDDPNRALKVMGYSEFLQNAKDGKVKEIALDKFDFNRVFVFELSGDRYRTIYYSETNLEDIAKLGVDITEDFHPAKESDLAFVLMNALLYTGLLVMVKFMMSGSSSKDSDHDNVLLRKQRINFSDVRGVDEAKAEFQEIIDLFVNQQEYKANGVRVPRGVLLYGPPGTGKTLLAKAAAYESNATFIAATGSSFVQMFVGVGALRVRQAFKKARKARGPAIIFIDEIDALCGSRAKVGSTEHSSTVNAVLAEMDGFRTSDNILVIGATNSPDSLDSAVTRPGRFDRHIYVGKPSLSGRRDLFELYLSGLKMSESIDLMNLARSTTGFSGAQIAYVTNEAMILAIRNGRKEITMADMEKARDRLLLGYENKTREVAEKEKAIAAYHEAGHAIVASLNCAWDHYVDKISIVPHGSAAGYTLVLEERDRLFETKKGIRSKMMMLLGGRAAEEVAFGRDGVTTGAADDISKVTMLASDYAKSYGFDSMVGLISVAQSSECGTTGLRSGDVVNLADRAVRELISKLYEECVSQLKEHSVLLDCLAKELVERETLSKGDLERIFKANGLDPLVEPVKADWGLV